MSNQLLRSGTSIGANVNEAIQGQSRKDFLHKMSIALKEAAETEYWIKLLFASDYLNKEESEVMLKNCQELIKLLTTIVKTTRNNLAQ